LRFLKSGTGKRRRYGFIDLHESQIAANAALQGFDDPATSSDPGMDLRRETVSPGRW